MQNEWKLHLLRVVIEDGNPELHVGEVFDWTVTFWPQAVLTRSTAPVKTAVPVEKNYYRINAEILHIAKNSKYEFCILDFGMMAISESATPLGLPLLPGCQEGDFVAGEIRLELPLSLDANPYNLRYKWRVNRVCADLANFRQYPGDLTEPDYREIPGTDSLKAGSYVLSCTNLSSVT